MKILEDSKLFLRNHGPGFSHNEGGRERERGKGGREGGFNVFVAFIFIGIKDIVK